MGATRRKEPSKRSQKTIQRTDAMSDISNISPNPEIETPEKDTHGEVLTSMSSLVLAPLALSSRESRSSLHSSASSTSRTTRHDLDIYYPSRIEVKSTPNKGYALFAVSHIPKGTIVLAERPTVRLTTEDEAKEHAADEVIKEKFSQLSKKTRKDFKKLHNADKAGFSKLRSIYHSNCYNLDGSRSTFGGSCVGLTASRINHSCIPNVQFTFLEIIPERLLGVLEDNDSDAESDLDRSDPAGGVMVFRALKAISKGKEILSNYETVYAVQSQRQFQLRIHYGFQCDCDACSPLTEFWKKDDDRRQQMIRHRDKVDAIEARIISKKEVSPNSSKMEVCHLRSEDSNNADRFAPLSIGTFNEVMSSLEALDELLTKDGLMGIELQRVREEKTEWKRRWNACNWGSALSI